ncbi:hypothetical protein [Kitasatospora phosalacinea]|uniref:Uncharacterized protein n=1 Tax=Kitasatospora phosalacinea TaxID=2065 RepID=A0ABW6GEP4_9ACTN
MPAADPEGADVPENPPGPRIEPITPEITHQTTHETSNSISGGTFNGTLIQAEQVFLPLPAPAPAPPPPAPAPPPPVPWVESRSRVLGGGIGVAVGTFAVVWLLLLASGQLGGPAPDARPAPRADGRSGGARSGSPSPVEFAVAAPEASASVPPSASPLDPAPPADAPLPSAPRTAVSTGITAELIEEEGLEWRDGSCNRQLDRAGLPTTGRMAALFRAPAEPDPRGQLTFGITPQLFPPDGLFDVVEVRPPSQVRARLHPPAQLSRVLTGSPPENTALAQDDTVDYPAGFPGAVALTEKGDWTVIYYTVGDHRLHAAECVGFTVR